MKYIRWCRRIGCGLEEVLIGFLGGLLGLGRGRRRKRYCEGVKWSLGRKFCKMYIELSRCRRGGMNE